MRKVWKCANVIPLIILVVAFFMSIGYASINSVLFSIDGDSSALLGSGMFIQHVKFLGSESSGVDISESEYIDTYQTTLHTKVTLSDTDCNSYVMLEMSIYNGTDSIYLFKGTDFDSELYSNSNIVYEVIGFSHEDMIVPGQSKTFKMKFYYANNSCTVGSGNNVLDSYINFNFFLEHFRWDSYTYNGFDLIEISSCSRNSLRMNISPEQGPYDRFVIPIDNLEVGSYYTITFTEKKTLKSGSTYINNSKKYIYGTTVTTKEIDNSIGNFSESFILPKYFNYDNNPLHTAFMWKEPFLEVGYTEGKTYTVSMTFYALEETMYWLWDFSNIANNSTVDFNLTKIDIRKVVYPSNEPYLRFVDTTYNDNWTYDIDYDDDGVDDENGQNYLKYSYRTNATEDALDLRIETGQGWEYFNVPIKNLTIGKKYKITYTVNTTPTKLTVNTSNYYGSIIRTSAYTGGGQLISSSNASSTGVSIVNKTGSYSGSIQFTASAATMYWTWQCGGINNWQWANIKLSNVNIVEV